MIIQAIRGGGVSCTVRYIERSGRKYFPYGFGYLYFTHVRHTTYTIPFSVPISGQDGEEDQKKSS